MGSMSSTYLQYGWMSTCGVNEQRRHDVALAAEDLFLLPLRVSATLHMSVDKDR